MKKQALIFFFLFFIPFISLAQQTSDISTSLVNHAKYLIEKGELSEAITELSQALLIDPENSFASEQLIAIFDNSPVMIERKLDLLILRDLTLHSQRLKERAQYFQEKAAKMKDLLIERGYSTEALNDELRQIKKEITPEIIEDKEIQTSDPLKAAILNLENLTYSLRKDINVAKIEFNQLRAINHRYSEIPICGTINYNVPIVVDTAGDTADSNVIMVLKRQIAMVQKQLFDLKENLQSKDKKIEALSNELVDFALKIKEHETMIANKASSITSMKEEIAELNSRIELNQQIVRNKDARISDLLEEIENFKAKLLKQTDEMKVELGAKEKELRETRGFLAIYQEQLTNAKSIINLKDADVTTLEDQLEIVQQKLYQKELELKSADERIYLLQEELRELKKKCQQELSSGQIIRFIYSS
jgi:DNA repair exonuclease SbcCD ATPase subunit